MAYHHQLLEQAFELAKLDRKKPRQANLRRAISSAYYALFHLLVYSASLQLAGAQSLKMAPSIKPNNVVARWFTHTTMAKISKLFAGPEKSKALELLFAPSLVTHVTPSLKDVARAFLDLQQERHTADYDLGAGPFRRQDVLSLVERTKRAFADWETAQQTDPLAPLYLTLLLTGESVIVARS